MIYTKRSAVPQTAFVLREISADDRVAVGNALGGGTDADMPEELWGWNMIKTWEMQGKGRGWKETDEAS